MILESIGTYGILKTAIGVAATGALFGMGFKVGGNLVETGAAMLMRGAQRFQYPAYNPNVAPAPGTPVHHNPASVGAR